MACLPFNLRRLWDRKAEAAPECVPLAFPPPFRRMLAINSDVEMTRWPMQMDLFRLLAERELETAFSYWFFGDPDVTWHLFNRDFSHTKEEAGAMILLKGGLLDTLHSFTGARNGRGYSFDREMIRQGYSRLKASGVASRVYSNHGTVDDIQNIGGEWVGRPGYPDYMKGDVPGAERYHLDLSIEYGMRFFWLDIDRVREHLTFLPTVGEGLENLFVSQICRDGNRILRFRRTDALVDPDGALLGEALARVIAAPDGGYTVIYTHLGVKRDPEGRPIVAEASDLPPGVFTGLDRLAGEQRAGRILVTTTERLLIHALMSAARPWTITRKRNRTEIHFNRKFTFEGVAFDFGWQDFMGFCLPVGPKERVRLCLDGAWKDAERWTVAGQSYAGLAWHPIPMKSLIERAAGAARV
jgi:hypothetical protein